MPYMIGDIKKDYSNNEYRKALNQVFILHIVMFCVAFTAAIMAQSSAVLADSLDFIGDAMSYALSIFVINRSLAMRATVSIAKAVTMLSFGLPVMIYSMIRFNEGTAPDYAIMNYAGILGIFAHLFCIYKLFKFRSGDSNRLSVWICTINDLLSNVITVIASQVVMFTDSVIPDIVAAGFIVSIAILGALVILRQAIQEIKNYKSERGYA